MAPSSKAFIHLFIETTIWLNKWIKPGLCKTFAFTAYIQKAFLNTIIFRFYTTTNYYFSTCYVESYLGLIVWKNSTSGYSCLLSRKPSEIFGVFFLSPASWFFLFRYRDRKKRYFIVELYLYCVLNADMQGVITCVLSGEGAKQSHVRALRQ